ncbi:Cof-type HAD-IIB family hydrolase [Microbacterium sp. APC 3898]|uniref:Cof-type HAD-IIB family hydrolase n=1 Tax=Planococcus notacanthi TaxID=3035188 RepID=A0ABT7ZFJ3_9BACL|nr:MULTISPECIES: Cof-type HAD-IIB family hydrolase [Terrabacteria group]MDN3425925.1 Cof-type HAD-IIB family hydrolase [Planococcus sp. APC 4016]MDN3437519.1 Cof-type HAD-IIB family hydrolase [Planococcus sp. APC 3900]MDN3497622.1 Cof-type HAD-IIB family hydrolase [Microbacterium sp. APC 3898]
MKQHLIVLDLDGTLLTDQKVISPKTKLTLNKALEAGHQVMIATGRPYRSSEPYYKELGLTTPIVNFNGAFVHHPANQYWGMHHNPIGLDVVHEVVESMHNYEFHNIVAEVLDDVYVHHHDEKLMDIFRFGDPTITTGDLRNYLKTDPTSILIHAPFERVQEIHDHLSSVHAEVIDHRRWGAPWHVIEIVKSGMSKAVGLDRVSKSLGISRENIIAFGDEDNDLEMIDFAGVGVAMGNAIDPLKNIANEITLTNNEDGIAELLIDRLKL